ncbi:MAG: nucleotidyltransferase domain-containing protein [Nanoarchaeota archaeon]|nr:nucleotidyltransferase domain-containing protein [Nanoarchaeota archaeon]
MEQKYYRDFKLEIVLALLKNEGHIREIAKTLHTNHMTIGRKMKELSDENVVDYKIEGKNKTYFIKKTLEAKNYVFIAELYKLNKILKKYPRIRRIVEAVQKNNKIKLVLLFGSYAKEIPKPESDIDLYIEVMDKEIIERIKEIDTKLSIKIGKYDKSNLLIKEIKKNHVILKGMEVFYEKNGFFE